MTGAPGSGRTDLADRGDIAALVTDFYTRAFADPLIGPIFTEVAHLNLTAHLPIMCDFWETVLFHTGSYHRDALTVHRNLHAKVPLVPAHFDRWLQLWTATVDDRHAGATADHAKIQATRIATSISRRLLGASGARGVRTAAPTTPGGTAHA